MKKSTEFRVMKYSSPQKQAEYAALPEVVPFALVEEHAKQCQINHRQTPQRLNERGGLCPSELVCVLEDRDFWGGPTLTSEYIVTVLLQILADWENKS